MDGAPSGVFLFLAFLIPSQKARKPRPATATTGPITAPAIQACEVLAVAAAGGGVSVADSDLDPVPVADGPGFGTDGPVVGVDVADVLDVAVTISR